jgi:hypothetical protein
MLSQTIFVKVVVLSERGSWEKKVGREGEGQSYIR